MESSHVKNIKIAFNIFVVVMALQILASLALTIQTLSSLIQALQTSGDALAWYYLLILLMLGLNIVIFIGGFILFPELVHSAEAADRFNAMFPEPQPQVKAIVQPDPRIAQLKEAIRNQEKKIAQAILINLASEGVISKEDEANYQKIIDTLPLE
jgi:hypothetical protein